MLRKEDRLMIQKVDTLSDEKLRVLALLYLPCMGKEAMALYQLAYAMQMENHKMLCLLMGSSIERLEVNRKQLERYGLLKTYYDEANRQYIWQLFSPLNGMAFLRHEVFGRWYLSRFGKNQYEKMCTCFELPKVADNYLAISEPFQEAMDTWTLSKEENYQNLRPKTQLPKGFDYRSFQQISELVFPKYARTDENLAQIGKLALDYGMNALDMKKWVGKSWNIQEGYLDMEKLRYYVTHDASINQVKTNNNYEKHPLVFLNHLFPDVPIGNADKRLIELLLERYQFSYSVINFLLEYSLQKCDNKLVATYVTKVATSWKRNKVDTLELAKEAVRNETTSFRKNKKQDKPLPDWFYDDQEKQSQVEISDEEVKALLASIGGE